MQLAAWLINFLGYGCVEDAERLEEVSALCALMRACECKIFSISADRLVRRFRGGRGTFPSPRSIHDFLARFQNEEAGQMRDPCKAIVPEPVAKLMELLDISRTRIAMVAKDKGLTHVTLDMDATVVPSGKR